ncbi:MAG TPA: lipoprotein [Rhodocyclaceae bacterium]|nr:lipoprotein [Rhodocyclaceae bacterium]
MRLPLLLTLLFALAACGTRGPLELPPGPRPKPVFGERKPTSVQQTLPDNSNNPVPQ